MVICLILGTLLSITSCSKKHDNIFDFEQKKDGTLIVTAFFEKNNIKYAYVNIPQSYMEHTVTEIGPQVFEANVTMAGVLLPDTITTIGESAFANCSRLTEITLHSGLTTIENWAFYNCKSITALTLPTTVKTVGADAFTGMSGLTAYTGSVSYLSLLPSEQLTSVTLVATEEDSIHAETFKKCKKLSELSYAGSIAEWEAIPKSDEWFDAFPGQSLMVHCNDGDIPYQKTSK